MKKITVFAMALLFIFTGCGSSETISQEAAKDEYGANHVLTGENAATSINNGASSTDTLSSFNTGSNTIVNNTSSTSSKVVNMSISTNITKIVSDGTVAVVHFAVKCLKGGSFEPNVYVDFYTSQLTDETGRVIEKDFGHNHYLTGIHCHNDTGKSTDLLEGSFSILISQIKDCKSLKLTLGDMMTYIPSYDKAVNFDVSDYLKNHPELNKQEPCYKIAGIEGSTLFYEGVSMSEGHLGLRFSEDSNFEVDNICLFKNLLFIRINTDEFFDTHQEAHLQIYSGGEQIYSPTYSDKEDDTYVCFMYPLTDKNIADGVSIKTMDYNSVKSKANGEWNMPIPVENLQIETAHIITKAAGTVKHYGEICELKSLAYTSLSISISFNSVGTYTYTEERGICFYSKSGKLLEPINHTSSDFLSGLYVMGDDYSPQDFGAVVFYTIETGKNPAYYILYNFNPLDGTCQLKVIEATLSNRYIDLEPIITGLYSSNS